MAAAGIAFGMGAWDSDGTGFVEPKPSSSSEQWSTTNAPNGWDCTRVSEPVHLSECRDLVLVPGGIAQKIRELSTSHDHICWEYINPSVLVHYHFNVAAASQRAFRADPKLWKTSGLPVFYGVVEQNHSPYEFSVRPKALDNARNNMVKHLNQFYDDKERSSGHYRLQMPDQMFVGVPCAVLVHDPGLTGNAAVDHAWVRARLISHPTGAECALVRLVDLGNEIYSKVEFMRPLAKQFGKLPPLAFKCRMKGVNPNDLLHARVLEFRETMESVGRLVRVELLGTEEPFLVNVFHPTIAGKNLGEPFLPKPLNEAQILKFMKCDMTKQQKHEYDEEYKESMAEMGDGEDDDYGSDEEFVPPPKPKHVLHFGKAARPFPDDDGTLTVAHITNTRLIYLHARTHLLAIDRVQGEISRLFDKLDQLPLRALMAENACALEINENLVIRAFIDTVSPKTILFHSVDYGYKVAIPRNCVPNRVRALPADLDQCGIPYVFVCRLENSLVEYPHTSETAILREIMPVGSKIRLEQPRRSTSGPPFKVYLNTLDGEEVECVLERMKSDRRVLHPCKQLVPYNPKLVRHLSHLMDPNYREEMQCPHAISRGKYEACTY